MEDFLHFLSRYWFLIIILLPWIGSVLGDVFTKAVQKATAEERARRRRARSEGLGGATGQEELPKRATADEVAAEIRRMMGMEIQEERRSSGGSGPVVVEPADREWQWEQAPEWQQGGAAEEPTAPQPFVPEPEPRAWTAGDLEQRLAEKEDRQISTVVERHVQPATAGGGLHDHHLRTDLIAALRSRGRRGARRRASRGLRGVRSLVGGGLVDLGDPARAFVMLEVLGKPKALREERP